MKHEITSLNTKKALAESLKKIMRKKSFSKISVSEIVADCGVNRKTFYYHFEDTQALLKWMFENEAIEVIKHFDLVVDYEEAILFVMDYIEENDYIINCAYDAIGREQAKRFFSSDFNALILSVIQSSEEKVETVLDDEYRNFICHFFSEALGGILIDWIINRKERNRKQIIGYLERTMKEALFGILENNKRLPH